MKNLTNYKTALLVSFFMLTTSLISFGQITVVGGGTYTTNSSTLVIDRPESLSINDVMIVEIIQHSNDIPIVLDEALIAEGWNPIAHSFLNTTTKACTSLLYRIATADDLEADSYTFTLFYDTKFAAGGITAYTGVGIDQGYTETGEAGGPFDAVPQSDFTKGQFIVALPHYVTPIKAESIETNTSNAAVSLFAANIPSGMGPDMRLVFYEQQTYTSLSIIYNDRWYFSDLSLYYDMGLAAGYIIQPQAGITGEGQVKPGTKNSQGIYNGILIALREACEAPEVSIVRSSEIICHGSDAEFQLKGTPWAEFTYRFNGMTEDQKLRIDNNGNCTLIYRSADEDVTLTILSAINEAGCGRVLNESSTVIVAESPEIVSQSDNLALCIDDIARISVEATGTELHYQWYRVAEGGEDIAIGDDSPELEIDPVSITDAGDYYVEVFNYWCPSVQSATVKLAVKELIVSPSSVQVTDQVTFTAVLHNGNGGFPDYSSVLFKLDGQPQSDLPVGLIADGSDLAAQLAVPVFEVPGVKTVTAEFWGDEPAPDGEVLGCIPSQEMTVLCEDAEIEYNGVQIQATEDINTTTALVHLVGVISEDNDGSNWDADHVPYIPLCMTFYLYQCDPGTTDCFPAYTATVGVSVQMTPENSLMGTASAYFEIPIGPAGYEQFTVEVVNEGCGTYYCDATPEYSTLLVYIPEGDFVTGGGKIITNDSYGDYAGAPGTMTNFGFHVKNNKTGKNLQGGMNIIYRRDVAGEMHNYQIKTNAMLTLGVDASDPENQLAVFTSKANLRDLTTGLDVEGNLRLFVTMADNGEPGDNDQVGFTLWRINARGKITDLVYSSSWSGRKTIERILSGGNLVVHSGFEIKSGVIDPESLLSDMEVVQPVLEVYPNPYSDWLRFGFVSPADTRARIEIYDLQGRLISTVFDSPVEKGVSYSVEYSPENEPNGLYFYRTIIGEEIFNGKIALKR